VLSGGDGCTAAHHTGLVTSNNCRNKAHSFLSLPARRNPQPPIKHRNASCVLFVPTQTMSQLQRLQEGQARMANKLDRLAVANVTVSRYGGFE
jgi:hypothetical protein